MEQCNNSGNADLRRNHDNNRRKVGYSLYRTSHLIAGDAACPGGGECVFAATSNR